MRFFNTAGPCRPERHFMLPPERRLPSIMRLIAEEQYFVVHAPRQSGKTTAMLALAASLRAQGTVALHVSLESSRQTPNVEAAEPRWLESITRAAEADLPIGDQPPTLANLSPVAGARLHSLLQRWARSLQPRPLVLLLDEADSVEGAAMISLLAQLRDGFTRRPESFAASVVFIGMRDLRDYLVAAKGGLPPNPNSPFNVKSASLTLANFTRDEIAELYGQYTAETGQPFTPEAVARAWYWTRGQPFLVNALAYHLTRESPPVALSEPLTAEHIEAAKEALILSRTTHLDNLAHRLYEPRVARIMRPVLLGDSTPNDVPDDVDYVRDLGLLVIGPDGLAPANPLYREVIGRALSRGDQDQLPRPWWRWSTPDGRLDMPALVDAFLAWWREHADVLIEGANEGWREAAAHLVFMAFLQRVVNGGGSVTREYASGRGALDLLVEYHGERHIIELKRIRPRHASPDRVRDDGAAQLGRYVDTLRLAEGWLLVFDQRPDRTWEERLWREDRTVTGERVKVLHLRGA